MRNTVLGMNSPMRRIKIVEMMVLRARVRASLGDQVSIQGLIINENEIPNTTSTMLLPISSVDRNMSWLRLKPEIMRLMSPPLEASMPMRTLLDCMKAISVPEKIPERITAMIVMISG